MVFIGEFLRWVFCFVFKQAHSHYSFGALSICLSMNYLDRFLSVYELPREKTWTVQLLAVACLSLATKMEETTLPLTVDLQVKKTNFKKRKKIDVVLCYYILFLDIFLDLMGNLLLLNLINILGNVVVWGQVGEPKFVFEGKTIQRMELLVLSTLNWKMQACTPCSFIDYFLRKIIDVLDGDLNAGIDFLEFRPSEIAAAVAISVSGEMKTVGIDKAVVPPCFLDVEKGRVLKCLELMQDLALIGIGATDTSVGGGGGSSGASVVPSLPQSPIGVLDAAACLSYKSDDLTIGSCANSSHTSPDTKRRKLDNHPSQDNS
ncbi:hypothetical protein U1Q18_011306 [Sarracenia purpurea var. burkii]